MKNYVDKRYGRAQNGYVKAHNPNLSIHKLWIERLEYKTGTTRRDMKCEDPVTTEKDLLFQHVISSHAL